MKRKSIFVLFLAVLTFAMTVPSYGQWISKYGFKRLTATAAMGVYRNLDDRFGEIYDVASYEYGGEISIGLLPIGEGRYLYGVFSYIKFNADLEEYNTTEDVEGNEYEYKLHLNWDQAIIYTGARLKWFIAEQKLLWIGGGYSRTTVLEKGEIDEEVENLIPMDHLVDATKPGAYVEFGYSSVVIDPFSFFINVKYNHTFGANFRGFSGDVGIQLQLF